MNVTDALNDLANRFGILPGFHDLGGVERLTSPDSQKALLRGAGLVLDNDAMIHEARASVAATQDNRILPPEIVILAGQDITLDGPDNVTWFLQSEQHSEIQSGRGAISLDALPSGVYLLETKRGAVCQTTTLIVRPARLPTVHDITNHDRIWGLNLALYGLRSSRDGGLGDFEDLALLAQTAAASGAAFVGINPVHALGWTNAGTYSPYSPTHRRFLNTAHIAIDQIDGAKPVPAMPHATTNWSSDMVCYESHQIRHQAQLELAYGHFLAQADAAARIGFQTYCTDHGPGLALFALFETLAENYGPDWRKWPGELHDVNGAAIVSLQRSLSPRIQFHSWLQWVADTQLAEAQGRARAADMGLGLYLDLAVGPRRGGAENWCEMATVAQGVSIGAPPDHLSPAGQNWDLTAFAPAKLSADRFKGWRRTIAQAMRHAGVFRIDHVLGLNRSFWIPDDGSPGGYIKQPSEVLFALIAIAAEQANTVVIGEDLGLVPPGFRDDMQRQGFYGYSVLQYEKDDNGRFRKESDIRAQSLACFATHDTPTLKGYWQGRDIDWWLRLGWIDEDQARQARDTRRDEIADLQGKTDSSTNAPHHFGDFRDSVHTALARSPAAMVSIQLDDLLGHSEAQNLPGTINEHPNWKRRYSVPLESLQSGIAMASVSQIMAQSHRNVLNTPAEETDHDC